MHIVLLRPLPHKYTTIFSICMYICHQILISIIVCVFIMLISFHRVQLGRMQRNSKGFGFKNLIFYTNHPYPNTSLGVKRGCSRGVWVANYYSDILMNTRYSITVGWVLVQEAFQRNKQLGMHIYYLSPGFGPFSWFRRQLTYKKKGDLIIYKL